MARGKRVLGAVVEELIGLSTMLIPEPKYEPVRMSLEGFGDEAVDNVDNVVVENIHAMKTLLEELKKSDAVTCAKCVPHLDRIEEELNWMEQRVPTYERVARLRHQLREVLDAIKPGLPELPEREQASEGTVEG